MAMQRRSRTIRFLIGILCTVATVGAEASHVAAADPVPAFIPPTAGWLETVNYYRAMAGLGRVVEDTTLNPGAVNHSCYMLNNGISHDEDPTKPGYTASGDIAGNNGNVAVSTVQATTARSHIELWMTGPFHAIGLLRAGLARVGFGLCSASSSTSGWRSAATLNIGSGLVWAPPPTQPVLFPGNGTTTNLYKFITESPNPLTFCGWSGSAGLPTLALMPEAVTGPVTASMTGPNGPLTTCALWAGNTSGVASDILRYDNAVSVIPSVQLSPGTYSVKITTAARTVTWSFTVDPTAATGVMPVPQVQPTGATAGYTPTTPFRFADSRNLGDGVTPLRITKLLAATPKKIRMAGVANIPSGITAVSANITVVNRSIGSGGSFLTVYDCAATPPTASTLNFLRGEVIANAGIFPVTPNGDLCVYSPLETDLIIDVNGYFLPTSNTRYTGLTPTPALDTTTRLNASGRFAAKQTVSLDVFNSGAGVPSTANAIAVIVTGVQPSTSGFVTLYPCGSSTPTVSNVNPPTGAIRSNFALVPLPSDRTGKVCIYAHTAQDVRLDVLGYFTTSGTGTFQPSAPTRFVDTRDAYRTEMNLNTQGSMLVAGTTYRLDVAGQRGLPNGAKAVSMNVTAVQPTANGSITVWACDASQPAAKSLNYATGRAVALAQSMQVRLSTSGELCFRSTANMHLVIDVNGWWY